MNRKILLVIISCFIGLLTAVVYATRIQHLRNEITGFTEKMPVLSAKRDLTPGESLQREDFATEFRMKNQVSKRCIAPEDLDLILGRRLFHPVPSGEVFLWTDITEGPRLRKPTEKIPEGYRAISLPADETHTMVHFISPGDSVDIALSDFNEGTAEINSKLIAEEIVVLGVGNRFEERSQMGFGDEYPLSVTLLTSPKEALKILKASQNGEIHFVARGSHPFPTRPAIKRQPDLQKSVTEY
jgi:Flp pilus assembly protein CpaB